MSHVRTWYATVCLKLLLLIPNILIIVNSYLCIYLFIQCTRVGWKIHRVTEKGFTTAAKQTHIKFNLFWILTVEEATFLWKRQLSWGICDKKKVKTAWKLTKGLVILYEEHLSTHKSICSCNGCQIWRIWSVINKATVKHSSHYNHMCWSICLMKQHSFDSFLNPEHFMTLTNQALCWKTRSALQVRWGTSHEP